MRTYCNQNRLFNLNKKRNKKINITDYESLLSVAKEQAEPQRLLFVFLKTSLPKKHKDEEASHFHSGQGGELEAVMCVDKTPNELSSFSDLVTESESMKQDWQIVLIACLSGRNGIVPSSDEATQSLKRMVQTVESGGSLSNFLAFDRNGNSIRFGNSGR